MFKWKKKGSALDGVYLFLLIIVIIFGMMMFLFFMRTLADGFTQPGIPQEAQDIVTGVRDDVRAKADNAIILWTFILIMGSWISSYFLDSNPVYFVIFMILSFVSFFILLPVVNVLYNFQFDVTFAQEVQYLPKTFFIVNHFAAFLAFYIITTGLVLYAKNKYQSRQINGGY